MSATVQRIAPARDRVPMKIVVALTGFVALPPLAIDMYLASLPEIGDSFDAPVGLVQLSLTLFLVVLGAGQLIAGPVSDAVGRRRPLLVGLALFVAGSVLAAMAPSMAVLLLARVVQGIGGGFAVVVANSSVRDHASGPAATRLFALLMSVVAIAPIISPAIGGVVDALLGWRAIFWVLAAIGAILLLVAAITMRESLPGAARTRLAPREMIAAATGLLRARAFALPSLALLAMFALLFLYIGGASYVYQGTYELDGVAFGLVFGATGVTMMTGSLLVGRLARRWSTTTFAIAGAALATLGGVVGVIAAITQAPFGLLLGGVVLIVFGLGVGEPALMGAAMGSATGGAGQAAAILGAGQYLVGALATAIAGFVATDTLAWAGTLTALALVSGVLAWASGPVKVATA